MASIFVGMSPFIWHGLSGDGKLGGRDLDQIVVRFMQPRNPQIGSPYDLDYSVLRSLSPIHIKYLKNVGVSASMSVSIIVEGKLWALFACHHMTAHRASHAVRLSCTVPTQVVSIRVSQVKPGSARLTISGCTTCARTRACRRSAGRSAGVGRRLGREPQRNAGRLQLGRRIAGYPACGHAVRSCRTPSGHAAGCLAIQMLGDARITTSGCATN